MRKELSSKGFTLIEVMVAITVLTIGILGIWSLHISAIHGNAFSNRMAEATSLGNQLAEEKKADSYSNLVDGTFWDKEGSNPVFVYPYTGCPRSYKRQWTIADHPSAPQTKQVTITVGYGGANCLQNVNNCEHRVIIITLISKLD